MFLEDLLIGPPLILIILFLAWLWRPYVSDPITKVYFLPGLICKIAGAILLGLIYQFYYQGGDTFAFHEYGSKIIWEAFLNDPVNGLKLWFADGIHSGEIYKYSSRIWYFRDPQSYTVIQIASFFDLFTFGTYTGTAIFFALIGFSGGWMLFITFYRRYPALHLSIALSVLLVPSVIFWASGILKDTLTFAAICWIIFAFENLFLQKKKSLPLVLIIIAGIWLIYSIKIFILLVLIPLLVLWFFLEKLSGIKTEIVKIVSAPLVIISGLILAYWAMENITKNDRRYSLDTISKTAQVTAYDIRYWTGKDAGSGYSLGELDGSFESLVRVAPAGVVVTLFRPFPWEVKNPLMLMSAIEGIIILSLTIFVLVRSRLLFKAKRILGRPELLFCLLFSITYAAAVGVSTYNFGTLARYKIPCIPFYLMALSILYFHSNKEKKRSLVDSKE